MVSKRQVEEFMSSYFPNCPICGSEEGYKVSGVFKDYVKCIACGAKWQSPDFVQCKELKHLMLWEACENGRGLTLLHKTLPVTFWRDLDKEQVKVEKLRLLGVNKKTAHFLCDRVLYPDQKAVCVSNGKAVDGDGVKRGVICVTNRSITLYQPKEKTAYDYKLTDAINFSYKRGFFSSMVEIQMKVLNKKEKAVERIIIQGVPKGKEERVISILKQTVEERKRFEDEQKSKGLVPYGFSHEKWGSKEDAKRWLERYLTSRGFKKFNDKWMTKQEYFDHQHRQKGLYKYIEAGIERWGTIDEILDGLSPHQFEDFIALLFKSMGYEVTNLPYIGDYGADLLVKRSGQTVVVQVKKYGLEHSVGAPEVQKTLGSIWKYKADRAVLVTTSTFTTQAYEQANGAPIELWDRSKLKETLEQHLPSNLIEEKPVPTRLFPKIEKICKAIISQTISYADPQTAVRIRFRVKRGEIESKFGIKRKTFGISVSAPIEHVSYLEKVMKERIPTIPIRLKSFFEKWLKMSIEDELKYVRKKYPELIKV